MYHKHSIKVLFLAVLSGVVMGAGGSLLLKKPTAPTVENSYFPANSRQTGIISQQSTSINYCHDKDKAKQWEGMRLKYPADVGILHLYALRIGLCEAVDNRKISLETAIDVFNVQHEKLYLERAAQRDPDRKLQI